MNTFIPSSSQSASSLTSWSAAVSFYLSQRPGQRAWVGPVGPPCLRPCSISPPPPPQLDGQLQTAGWNVPVALQSPGPRHSPLITVKAALQHRPLPTQTPSNTDPSNTDPLQHGPPPARTPHHPPVLQHFPHFYSSCNSSPLRNTSTRPSRYKHETKLILGPGLTY